MKLWKKPIIRQYWHRGLLWRASEVEEVASFELFVDLLYVGIISVIGDNAAENATGFSLLKFTVTFALAYKMWTDLSLIVSWFGMYPLFALTSISLLIPRMFRNKLVILLTSLHGLLILRRRHISTHPCPFPDDMSIRFYLEYRPGF